MSLLLGLDLCDDYCQISCFNRQTMDADAIGLTQEENSCLIPSVLCLEKDSGKWLIGQEALSCALQGLGTVCREPVKKLSRRGTATMNGTRYTAEDLLEILVRQLLDLVKRRTGEDLLDVLVITVPRKEEGIVESIRNVMQRIGIKEDILHILGHTEAYLYYVLSQKKEMWTNRTCLFDLADHHLDYYEMGVIRGRTPKIAEAAHEELEEGFGLDILEEPSGSHVADNIMSECARRLLDRKIMTSVFLTGKGFESADWAKKTVQFLCNRRRVFLGQTIFARGAAFLAYDSQQQTSNYPYVMICEGRVPATVSLKVSYEGRERQLVLIGAGTNWCEARTSVEVIPDDLSSLDFLVTPALQPVTRHLSLPLDELPQRPNKTSRLEVIVSFSGDTQMTVRVVDKGFGDFFPASGRMIRRDFTL